MTKLSCIIHKTYVYIYICISLCCLLLLFCCCCCCGGSGNSLLLFLVKSPLFHHHWVTGDDNMAQKPKAEKVPRVAEKPHGEKRKNRAPELLRWKVRWRQLSLHGTLVACARHQLLAFPPSRACLLTLPGESWGNLHCYPSLNRCMLSSLASYAPESTVIFYQFHQIPCIILYLSYTMVILYLHEVHFNDDDFNFNASIWSMNLFSIATSCFLSRLYLSASG